MKEEKILNEITTFCGNECASRECCCEDECVLYRIEKLTTNKTYQVEIKETIWRVVEVEAQNEEEAVDIVEEQYKNEEIVLTGDDACEYDISILKSDVNEE